MLRECTFESHWGVWCICIALACGAVLWSVSACCYNNSSQDIEMMSTSLQYEIFSSIGVLSSKHVQSQASKGTWGEFQHQTRPETPQADSLQQPHIQRVATILLEGVLDWHVPKWSRQRTWPTSPVPNQILALGRLKCTRMVHFGLKRSIWVRQQYCLWPLMPRSFAPRGVLLAFRARSWKWIEKLKFQLFLTFSNSLSTPCPTSGLESLFVATEGSQPYQVLDT